MRKWKVGDTVRLRRSSLVGRIVDKARKDPQGRTMVRIDFPVTPPGNRPGALKKWLYPGSLVESSQLELKVMRFCDKDTQEKDL